MTFLERIFGLSGKVVVVTGGSRGIGQAAAIGFAQAGATVVILSRSNADETIRKIVEQNGQAYHLSVDVTQESAVDGAINEIINRSGSIDVLFNNAGICQHQDSLDTSILAFQTVINVNLVGEFIVAKSVARVMIERGIPGSIINMASMSGSIVNVPQWQCSYNASKAAVIHMTRSLATEWAPYNIRVNSLSPGYIATAMAADTPRELKEAWLPLIPLHRMGTTAELIPALLYLASSASSYSTGSDIVVDGAYTCQ